CSRRAGCTRGCTASSSRPPRTTRARRSSRRPAAPDRPEPHPSMPRQRSATLVHEGGMRYVATTGSKRTIVYGDDIERGELSPVETLVVRLAACSAMDVWPISEKKRQKIDRYEIRVEATQRDEY